MNRADATMRAEVLALFPDGVAGADLGDLHGLPPLWPEERAAVAAAVEKRIREFTGGRTCARQALVALGINTPAAIPRGSDGAPVWPDRVVGSITHCDGYCGAVVAHAGRFTGLGLDAEVRGKVGPNLWAEIATEREYESLSRLSSAEALDWATVVFSAKEAFYKAKHPASRAWIGFHDVEVEAIGTGRFAIVLLQPVPGLADAGQRFDGRYLITSQHVFTGMSLPSRRA